MATLRARPGGSDRHDIWAVMIQLVGGVNTFRGFRFEHTLKTCQRAG